MITLTRKQKKEPDSTGGSSVAETGKRVSIRDKLLVKEVSYTYCTQIDNWKIFAPEMTGFQDRSFTVCGSS
jgi:hypothetical protein